MTQKAGIVDENGDVINVIVYDPEADYQPPEGQALFVDEAVEIGDRVVNGVLQKAGE